MVQNKILVTGGSGFIGRQSLPGLLARGFEVHAVAQRIPSHWPNQVTWHQTDLLDQSATEKLLQLIRPTHLLHFAWYVEHGKYLMSPENEKWVEASTYLAEVFAKNGGKRFVGAGSCYEYDWSQGPLCSETKTPLKPRGVYGVAKNQFHQELQSLTKSHLESYGWGRIFFLYGPGEPLTRLFPRVITALKTGQPLPPIFSGRSRDFLHVSDVGGAFAALAASSCQGAVNVASGETHKLDEFVFTVADLLKKQRPALTGPVEASDDEPPVLGADVLRLHNEVGWSPRFSFIEGLQNYVEHFSQV